MVNYNKDLLIIGRINVAIVSIVHNCRDVLYVMMFKVKNDILRV